MYAWAGREVDKLGNRRAQLIAWGARSAIFPAFGVCLALMAMGHPSLAFAAVLGDHETLGLALAFGFHAGRFAFDHVLKAHAPALLGETVDSGGIMNTLTNLAFLCFVAAFCAFAADVDGKWLKIPQIGRVVVGADVEIGANTTIDRGAIDDTRIEDDVKLDNQIQIGHNCSIGAHTAIAGCVGIAGSTRIGRNCRIGGAAMISGHLAIADGTVISGATLIHDSISEPGVYTGAFPTLPHREWKQVASQTRRLRQLAETRRILQERAVRR